MKSFFLILVALYLFSSPLWCQDHKMSKEDKLYSEAQDKFFYKKYEEAIETLNKLFKINPDNLNAMLLQSRIFNSLERYDESEEIFRNFARRHPEESYKADMQIATIKMKREQYKEAIAIINEIVSHPKTPANTKSFALKTKDTCEFRLDLMSDKYNIHRERLSDSINSMYDEYLPVLTADESRIFYTRIDFPETSPLGDEDFYFADKKDTAWLAAKEMGEAINSPGLEGALTISPDGKRMFFAAKERRGGYGNFDLYYTYRFNDQWVKPLNLGPPINDAGWESQPSVSADGTELYFAAKKYGNVGGIDIWMSKLVNNLWTKPVNLGADINTAGNEQSPYIHPDGHTLYFSSDGHLGLGSADIYMSRRDKDGKWAKPICLPYPINTKDTENGLFVNAEGLKGYYSAYNQENKNLDLYSFDLPEKYRPDFVTYVKGIIKDAETGEKIAAEVEIAPIDGLASANKVQSDTDGKFLLTMPSGYAYRCNINKDGYLFYSHSFDLSKNAHSDPYLLEIKLQKIKPAESFVLNNIFFETASYELKSSSFPELDKLYDMLQKNASMHITIIGHTDNVGSPASNLKLSLDRAHSVGRYLTAKGIDNKRLSFDGKGDTRPIADNSTEDGRSANRRVEINVVNR